MPMAVSSVTEFGTSRDGRIDVLQKVDVSDVTLCSPVLSAHMVGGSSYSNAALTSPIKLPTMCAAGRG